MSDDFFVSECPFHVGEVIECFYPNDNVRDVEPNLERRIFVIRQIRDCVLEPLSQKTLKTKPKVLRGRYLIKAQDATKRGWRSFYLESMWRPTETSTPVYQVASYDPIEDEPHYDYVGPVFTSESEPSFKQLLDDLNVKLNELNVVRNVTMRNVNSRGVADTTCGENSHF